MSTLPKFPADSPEPIPPEPRLTPPERRSFRRYVIGAIILALIVIGGVAYFLSWFR